MSVSKDIKRAVLNEIEYQLQKEGFKKCGKQTYTLSAHSLGVVGWLGLNIATRRSDSKLEINPMIGVRHQKLEEVVAKLNDRAPHKCIPPTIVDNIGYLMSKKSYLCWLFGDSNNLPFEVASMVDTINISGRQFMNKEWGLQELIDCMAKERLGNYREYCIPAALGLLQKFRESKAFVMVELSKLGNRTDDAANEYRKFAMNLQDWLSRGGEAVPGE